MKYLIVGKILGPFFKEEGSFRIGECIIKKDHLFDRDVDIPEIPVRNRGSEFHVLSKNVRNFVVFSQEPISTRAFESDYVITTEVESHNLHHAIKEARERFLDAINVLTLSTKTTMVSIGRHRHFREEEMYDFEILSAYLVRGGEQTRLKIPTLISQRNFFPKKPPLGFVSRAKKYLDFQFQDRTFRKAMIYLTRANKGRHDGVSNGFDKVLNLIKCIEFITDEMGKSGDLGITSRNYKKLRVKEKKEYLEVSGRVLKVGLKNISAAKRAWDARNKADIAHADPYYNYYSKYSQHPDRIFDYQSLETSAVRYLVGYFKYRQKHPLSVIHF